MMRAMRAVTILALLLVVGQVKADPVTFNFQFDNQGFGEADGIVTPPLVGSRTFTIDNNPGPGTYTLAALGTFSLSFTFTDGNTYTQTDIASDPTKSEAVIVSSGVGERLYFSDPGFGGGGPEAGSLDLVNSNSDLLSFEPSFSAVTICI